MSLLDDREIGLTVEVFAAKQPGFVDFLCQ